MHENRPEEGNPTPVLDITLRTGVGAGRTPLSAFDTALLDAGVANYNLVRLSSVIPRAGRLRRTSETLRGLHGDRLYCVYAEAHASAPGQIAWAGVGWIRDASGDGLFVEHVGESREHLVEQIELSLADMAANRGGGYGQPEYVLACAEWADRPACALVVAAYEMQTWTLS